MSKFSQDAVNNAVGDGKVENLRSFPSLQCGNKKPEYLMKTSV